MVDFTPDRIAQTYRGLVAISDFVNRVLEGNQLEDRSEAIKKAKISESLEHIKNFKSLNIWTDQDFSHIDATVSAAENYVNS